MKITPRTRKLNESIREALASILLEEVQDPRVDFATITGARISPDMRYCEIYVTAHGDAERYAELMKGLESAKGRIRNSLGKRVSLRFLPALRFHIDESVDEGMRISMALRDEAERRPITPDEAAE
ncbi:MAG: ribosome-binding factor A [Actinobacteria bacterium HGW-Actinobacteria-6]|jgi:ribosome-binding factor A|nr:MAG: ribosome-binding factor A [Actinobacteria bacterium HGW-Actinobacteria-6]